MTKTIKIVAVLLPILGIVSSVVSQNFPAALWATSALCWTLTTITPSK